MPPAVNKSTLEYVRDGSGMSNTRLAYFEKDDILHLVISDEPEAGSIEISPNITAELNDQGELIGIEILSASAFIRDAVVDSVQARMLALAKAKTSCRPIRSSTFLIAPPAPSEPCSTSNLGVQD